MEFLLGTGGELQAHHRKTGSKLPDNRGQAMHTEGLRDPDGQRPFRLADVGQHCPGFFGEIQYFFRILQEAVTGFRQPDAPAQPVKERNLQIRFKGVNLGGYARLGVEAFFSGTVEA